MTLASRAETPSASPQHGFPCSIGAVVDAVAADPVETAALNRILYELGWSATQVYEALTDEGFTIGRQSINKHRGRKCRCFKAAA